MLWAKLALDSMSCKQKLAMEFESCIPYAGDAMG